MRITDIQIVFSAEEFQIWIAIETTSALLKGLVFGRELFHGGFLSRVFDDSLELFVS
jgi:hypothetical protein